MTGLAGRSPTPCELEPRVGRRRRDCARSAARRCVRAMARLLGPRRRSARSRLREGLRARLRRIGGSAPRYEARPLRRPPWRGSRHSRRGSKASCARPKTCKPSPIRMSLISQRKASSRCKASAGSASSSRPQSRARPVSFARQRIALASSFARLRSSICASAYSSRSASISNPAPWFCAAFKGGVRWPTINALKRRFACAASPGLLTMKG